MPLRSFLHISHRSVQVLLYLILCGVVLFFVLTRTQVGRDQLRDQIEWQFNNTFEGRLSIGELKGNLLNDLFARDIRLYDPAGRLLLSLDSAVVHPSWRDLFQRRFTAGRLTLMRPHFELIRQADGTWNFEGAFHKRKQNTSASGQSSWSFTSADLHIVDGTIRTRNEGDLPEAVAAGHLFNFADAQLTGVDARATVEWQRDLKFVELDQFSGASPDLDLSIETLRGQFVLEKGHLSLNEVVLGLDQTYLELAASASPVATLSRGAFSEAGLHLDLKPSRLDFTGLRRLFPSLPLADTVRVSGRVHGSLPGLVVETFSLERGQTHLTGEGTVVGLPERAEFDVAFVDNTVAASDLFAVWPAAGLPDFSHLGRLHLSLESEGTVPLAPSGEIARAASRVRLSSEAGSVAGLVQLTREADRRLNYTMDLSADTLDLGRVVQDHRLRSRLNGRLALQGSGLTLDDLQGEMHLGLDASLFAGRSIDTLNLAATATERRLESALYLGQRGGTLYAQGHLDLRTPEPAYRADITTRGIDLGPLVRAAALETDLNARLTFHGTGLPGAGLQGEAAVAFDSSHVRYGEDQRLLAPNHASLTLRGAGSAEPRLTVTGDLLDLQLDGDVAYEPLLAVSRLWSTALAEAVRQEIDKPYHRTTPPTPLLLDDEPLRDFAAQHLARLREAVRVHLQEADHDAVRARADLHLKRADLLSAFLPMLPPFALDLHAQLTLDANAEHMALSGSIAGDSLEMGSVRADHLDLRLASSADLDAPLASSLLLELDGRADTLRLGDQHFRAPHVTVHFEDEAARIALAAQPRGQADPLRLGATLDLLHDRNRLTLSDFFFAAGDYAWENPQDEPVDLYADAVVVHGLTLESRSPAFDRPQLVHLYGTLSSAPEDTVFVRTEQIALRQISDMLALKRPVGGLLDGQVALTGGTRHPELTGEVKVAALTFDNRLLGQLTATSRYVPGSPDVALDAFLLPASPGAAPATATPLIAEENRLHVGGTFRLPRFDEEGRVLAQSALALEADIERADLFFFEYLFPDVVADVQGYVAGHGRIGGSFTKPLFEAALDVREGKLKVPTFNLTYEVAGPVTVDARGIHLREAVVRDPTGGRAVLSGGLLFNDYQYFSFDVGARLEDLQVINVLNSRHDLAFYGRIWASGTATLTGPLYDAFLRSTDLVTTARSETFIPITESNVTVDPGFIVFADSTGQVPDLKKLTRRRNVLSARPVGERMFLDGLDMDLNIFAPSGSTVHLVIDPLLGDVINAVGSGRIQLQLSEGEFATYGSLDVEAGDYLFTAGDVFFRRFLIDSGTISWDGDPVDAVLDIEAAYRTRASKAGLNAGTGLIPVVVQLHITGRVSTPVVDLSLAVDRKDRDLVGDYQGLEAVLNQPDRATEYATSVLLTNSFLLTPSELGGDAERTSTVRDQLAFTSVSQLVSSQINRYINQAVPNLDLNLGVQREGAQDLDLTYGVALRLLDERLVIRGEGVYQSQQGEQNRGEFVVEVRLSPNVSVEVFYRREGDALYDQSLTNTTAGAGLSYQTQFSSWNRLFRRILSKPDRSNEEPEEEEAPTPQETVANSAADHVRREGGGGP